MDFVVVDVGAWAGEVVIRGGEREARVGGCGRHRLREESIWWGRMGIEWLWDGKKDLWERSGYKEGKTEVRKR